MNELLSASQVKIYKAYSYETVGRFEYEIASEDFNFPVGEFHTKIDLDPYGSKTVDLSFEYESDAGCIELLMKANALCEAGFTIRNIYIPYFPGARQDRINVAGEPFSLKVYAQLVNSIPIIGHVIVTDPHSDVAPALINKCKVIHQYEIFKDVINKWSKENGVVYLISPDAGALKKIHKLADVLDNCEGVIECGKNRNPINGKIEGVKVPVGEIINRNGGNFWIVDDCATRGIPFIVLAKEIRGLAPGSTIVLAVTHVGGNWTDLSRFSDIDMIFTRKGRVK